jgi:hypothetical protein
MGDIDAVIMVDLVLYLIDFSAPQIWSILFPLCTVDYLPRFLSDHNPIILKTSQGVTPSPRQFRFEKTWLKEEEFNIYGYWSFKYMRILGKAGLPNYVFSESNLEVWR